MRVGVLATSFYPAVIYGGPIYSVLGHCQALSDQGVRVDVVTTNANGSGKLDVPTDRAVAFGPNFSVRYFEDTVVNRFSLPLALSGWRSVAPCDVFHSQELFYSHVPHFLLAAKLANKPTMLSPRGVLSGWALSHRRRLAKRAWLSSVIRPFARTLWWHATSESEREAIMAVFPEARITVIPNGVNLSAYGVSQIQEREVYLRRFTRTNIQADTVIVSAGRLHKIKAYDILVSAFSLVVRHRPRSVLLIAGADDGERAHLLAQIAALGLERTVFLVGHLNNDELREFLEGADVFALTSHSENFGNVVIEALAAGLPVVASKGTPWQVLEDSGCGRWVTLEPTSIANALIEMLAANNANARLKARALAESYGWTPIAKAFLTVYELMIRSTGEHGTRPYRVN